MAFFMDVWREDDAKFAKKQKRREQAKAKKEAALQLIKNKEKAIKESEKFWRGLEGQFLHAQEVMNYHINVNSANSILMVKDMAKHARRCLGIEQPKRMQTVCKE